MVLGASGEMASILGFRGDNPLFDMIIFFSFSSLSYETMYYLYIIYYIYNSISYIFKNLCRKKNIKNKVFYIFFRRINLPKITYILLGEQRRAIEEIHSNIDETHMGSIAAKSQKCALQGLKITFSVFPWFCPSTIQDATKPY